MRISAVVRLRHLMFTAPRRAPPTPRPAVGESAGQRGRPTAPRADVDPVLSSTKTAAVTLARRIHGLDAELGIIHTDRPNRDSLAFDLLEAIRPDVDPTSLDSSPSAPFVAA